MTAPTDAAVAGLARAYGAMPKFVALVRALVGPLDNLRTQTLNLLAMLDPLTAEGVYLDLMGIEVDQTRDLALLASGTTTVTDDIMRLLIVGKGAVNRTKGTREEFLALLSGLANSSGFGVTRVHVTEGFAWVDVTVWRQLTSAEMITFPAVARIMMGAGVRLRQMLVPYLDSPTSRYILGYPGDTQVPAGFTVIRRGAYEVGAAIRPYYLESLAQ